MPVPTSVILRLIRSVKLFCTCGVLLFISVSLASAQSNVESSAQSSVEGSATNGVEGSIDKLLTFTETLEQFSATFQQTVYDANSSPLQSSSGTVSLKRPGRFVWVYTNPSPQTIVADGNSIWLYDQDLEQVTVTTIQERASGTPLALLMGESPVDQEFSVKALGMADGIDWFELTPKSGDSDFELVFLGLNDGGLAVMELRDSFGQATQIRFSDFNRDVELKDSLFNFVPPEGVDVIGQG